MSRLRPQHVNNSNYSVQLLTCPGRRDGGLAAHLLAALAGLNSLSTHAARLGDKVDALQTAQ